MSYILQHQISRYFCYRLVKCRLQSHTIMETPANILHRRCILHISQPTNEIKPFDHRSWGDISAVKESRQSQLNQPNQHQTHTLPEMYYGRKCNTQLPHQDTCLLVKICHIDFVAVGVKYHHTCRKNT